MTQDYNSQESSNTSYIPQSINKAVDTAKEYSTEIAATGLITGMSLLSATAADAQQSQTIDSRLQNQRQASLNQIKNDPDGEDLILPSWQKRREWAVKTDIVEDPEDYTGTKEQNTKLEAQMYENANLGSASSYNQSDTDMRQIHEAAKQAGGLINLLNGDTTGVNPDKIKEETYGEGAGILSKADTPADTAEKRINEDLKTGQTGYDTGSTENTLFAGADLSDLTNEYFQLSDTGNIQPNFRVSGVSSNDEVMNNGYSIGIDVPIDLGNSNSISINADKYKFSGEESAAPTEYGINGEITEDDLTLRGGIQSLNFDEGSFSAVKATASKRIEDDLIAEVGGIIPIKDESFNIGDYEASVDNEFRLGALKNIDESQSLNASLLYSSGEGVGGEVGYNKEFDDFNFNASLAENPAQGFTANAGISISFGGKSNNDAGSERGLIDLVSTEQVGTRTDSDDCITKIIRDENGHIVRREERCE